MSKRKITLWYVEDEGMFKADTQPPEGMTTRAQLIPWAKKNMEKNRDFVFFSTVLKGAIRETVTETLEIC